MHILMVLSYFPGGYYTFPARNLPPYIKIDKVAVDKGEIDAFSARFTPRFTATHLGVRLLEY